MVQCPELCGRIASSLTTMAGRPAASRTSNSSTASRPITPSAVARSMASCWAETASSSSRPGAGASTSTLMPSRCTVSTTGYAAT